MHRFVLAALASAATAAGCMWPDVSSWLAPDSAATPGPTPRLPQTALPAASATAARVEEVGRKILAHNVDQGLNPRFLTIGPSQDGAPAAEIFHVGASDLYITETLVQRCTTEAQLAAVLCHELGKMASERAAVASPPLRTADTQMSLQALTGGGNAGSFGGPADQTDLASRAKFDRARPRVVAGPDPQPLARNFLTRAGYPAEELDAVAPLLREAAGNSTFEKQLAPK